MIAGESCYVPLGRHLVFSLGHNFEFMYKDKSSGSLYESETF